MTTAYQAALKELANGRLHGVQSAHSAASRFKVAEELQGDEYPGDPEPSDAQLPSATEAERVNEADDDRHRLARLFADDYRHPDGLMLRSWRDGFYHWQAGAYRPVPIGELRGLVSERVKVEFDRLNLLAVKKWEADGLVDAKGKPAPKPVARQVTTRLVADVVAALAGMTTLPSTVEPPCWLGEDGAFAPAAGLLACSNGLVSLADAAAGRPALHPYTPRFFTENVLDFAFDANAPLPTGWMDYLDRLWPEDAQTIAALQEWFGYCLTTDTRQKKILMMVGPKRSGKGTIGRILTRMIGLANCCAPTLAGLATNFGLWPLLGKTLAVVADARLSGRTDAATVVERLLSISGEDAQTVDRKNLPHVTTKLNTRFVVMSNELPRLNDPSGALVGRLVLLRLTHSWYGQEDTRLTERLLTELPGILNWAIAGWKCLQERGHFVQPESGRKLVADMEDLGSPVTAFLRECCAVGPQETVPVQELFTA